MKTNRILFLVVAALLVAGTAQAQVISAKSNPVKLEISSIPKKSPPVFTWLSPQQPKSETAQSKTSVMVGINTHPELEIKSVTLYKNGQLISGVKLSTSPQFSSLLERDLELTNGPNEIKVVAENDRGEITTESRIVNASFETTITYADLGINYLPKYYALIIGVSDYLNSGIGLPDLDKPVQDAQNLYDVLVSKYSFTPETTTLLKNPTREKMIDAFDALIRTVEEKDNVLVFYAGHGHHDKDAGFGFWLPSDAKRDSRSAWMANSQIRDYVGAMKSKHTLLITDACFSGSIFKTRRVDAMATALKINEIYRDKSRKAMTSGNLSEVPDESYFIRYLLKTLDENDQVYLTSTALFSRIFEPVTNNTTTTPQFGVVQGVGDEGGDFIFFKKM